MQKKKNATVSKLCMHARVRACETLGGFLYMTFYLCLISLQGFFYADNKRQYLEGGGGRVACGALQFKKCWHVF
jgi:hypothetical protein